jgi:hypothetical protein
MCYAQLPMRRVSLAVVVGFSALLCGWLYIQRGAGSGAKTVPRSAASTAGADAGTPGDDLDAGAGGASAALDFPPLSDDSEPLADAGATLPDGTPVPLLAEDRPKSVRFGVVLVQYEGAQGAKRGSRSRADADKLAAELATLAKDDFEAAVKKGDSGSAPDAGRMFRGILEPAPEYVLFMLEKDQVSDPVDTPRGLWIVKRLE